jgi:hypothetical protein
VSTTRRPRAALAAISLVATGFGPCAVEPIERSEDVSTLDMHLDVQVEDDGTVASVRLRLDGPDGALVLSEGDELTALADEVPLELSEDAEHVFSATGPAAPEVLSVLLTRADERERIDVDVPPPLSLVGTGTAADPIQLSWEAGPPGYELSVSVAGDCIRGISRVLSVDTGSYRIDPAELVADPPGAGCPLQVTLTRAARVSLAGETLRWSSSALQRRTIAVTWAP